MLRNRKRRLVRVDKWKTGNFKDDRKRGGSKSLVGEKK